LLLLLFLLPIRVEYCDECICLSVALNICKSMFVISEHIFGTTLPNFRRFSTGVFTAVAPSFVSGVTMYYVLPVLWMTLFFPIHVIGNAKAT